MEVEGELGPPGVARTKPRRRRIRSELDRLLSDEGTRNLLRAIKKTNTQKKPHQSVFRKRITKRVRVVKRVKSPSTSQEDHKLNNLIDFNSIALHTRETVGFITISFKDNPNIDDNHAISGAFNINVLQSVENAIKSYEQDANVNVIVLQSSHSKYFCNGLDLHDLLQPGKDNNSASKIVKAIKSLITTLNSSRKVLVASVTGDCVGFGVMILPLFDLVYANDKSMFKVHYNALGQSPEGIALFKNHLCGAGIGLGKITSLLYQDTPITAIEAESSGLVTETLWPGSYQEDLTMRLSRLTSSKTLSKTKSSIRTHKRNFKMSDLSAEFSAIETQWNSEEFHQRLKAFIQNENTTSIINGNNTHNINGA
ncbi:unnamed protein product [Orchesella dallaii]|uniref:Uncharacterized protein n=1 Tax=Orchesella dallaii TaxID=48710 RepID=A0ABP1PKE2_9HEXA